MYFSRHRIITCFFILGIIGRDDRIETREICDLGRALTFPQSPTPTSSISTPRKLGCSTCNYNLKG